ncbi:MAG TPA: class I SAM-dependent methyltransferase [Solirubrobacteraceae bacterium]|jgi:SAM-dependent methyltransferase|nr:class I SAM-dependent methyltransferase [Solirubrobacteraceae bacterium]
MNRMHGVICSSSWWGHKVESELLPWSLSKLELGDEVLEIGPGFGATTKVLAKRPGALTVLELEPHYCERLRSELPSDVTVVQGDATDMPFADGRFSAVVCFTMLHHLPSPQAQDRLMAQAARVLRPGGVFAGTDSLGTGLLFRLLHVGDTLVPVGPDGLPQRLEQAGLAELQIRRGGRSFSFRARKPA